MVLFDFKSGKHFVASADKTTLHIYELTIPTIHPSHIRKTHWREIASITPASDVDGGDDDEDQGDTTNEDCAAAEDQESYNGLAFFDGCGKIEGQEALTKLAQHLTRLRLIVSPQGQSFQDVAELGEHKDFGIHYLRLNDLFNWPYHGVSMASVTMWRRLVLKYTIPKREKRPVTCGGVSKEEYEELKKMVSKKDEELGKLREEMEETMQANAVETRKLRDQLSQRSKQSWAVTGATRFFSGSTIDARRRRPVPPETWRNVQVAHDHCYTYAPYTTGSSSPFPTTNWVRVDEDPKDWPSPPKIGTLCEPGQFDKSNWWFIKTYSPEGRLAMVAYYDGNQTSFTTPDNLHPLRVPFPSNSKLFTTTPFFLFDLDGALKLAFTYRD